MVKVNKKDLNRTSYEIALNNNEILVSQVEKLKIENNVKLLIYETINYLYKHNEKELKNYYQGKLMGITSALLFLGLIPIDTKMEINSIILEIKTD